LKQIIDCWYKNRHQHVQGKGKTTLAAGVLKELAAKKILLADTDGSFKLERSAIATAMKNVGVAPPPISHAWYEREKSSNNAKLLSSWWKNRESFRAPGLRFFPTAFKLGDGVAAGEEA
jgi:hypothetical protein